MKIKHQIAFIFLMLCLITISSCFVNNKAWYSHWLLSSLKESKEWYPKYGVYLWTLKLTLLAMFTLTTLLTLLYLKAKNIKYILQTSVFFAYFILAVLFEGNHPFSMVKMYSYLNDEVFIFYIDDCKGDLIPLNKVTNKQGAELSHLYHSFNLNLRIKKEDIGKLMWEQIRVKSSKSCMCLHKSKIGDFQDLQKKTTLLYEDCK